jgi:hypothetical protein
MFKKIILAAVLASAAALPAFAQGATCAAPAAPAVPADPAKASADDMRNLLAGANGFMKASDTYQQCLGNDIAAQKAAATKDKPFDPAIEKADLALVDTNQNLKQKVGTDANTALTAFKKAHNCDGKPLASCQ